MTQSSQRFESAPFPGRFRDPFAKFQDEVTSGKQNMVARFGHQVRYDLFEHLDPVEDRKAAERQKRALVQALRREGYTLYRNPTRYSVYVVFLDPDHSPDPARPWVYVGQTSLTPEERLAQHLARARNHRGRLYSRKVADHGLGLLPEEVEDLPSIYVVADALAWEAAVAGRLREDGYIVEGGT